VGKEGIKKVRKVWWHVHFINGFTDRINPIVKFIHKYIDGITDDITVGFKKKNRMVTWYFLTTKWSMEWLMKVLVNLSVIFNLWLGDRPSSPLPHSYLAHYAFFFLQQTLETTTPFPHQSQHNLTSHNKYGHHNTWFVSIRNLIQILLRILHFK
jgi:hypothetical protein